MRNPTLAILRKAVRGLLFLSEKDAPFEAAVLKGSPTKDNMAALLDLSPESDVEEVPFAKFFADLTKVQKWHAEDDKAVVKRYRDLLGILRGNLTHLQVFKVGKVRVKIAIVGKSATGEWIGLVTDSLET